MHKAAWIRVAVTVEGEDEPAHGFAETAIEAVRASVKLDPPVQYKNLKMTVTRIYEDSTPPEDQGTPDYGATPDTTLVRTSMGLAPTAAPTGPVRTAASTPTVPKPTSRQGRKKIKK